MRKCFRCPFLDTCMSPGGNRIGTEMEEEIYHEKQVKELCCLHALNNLFQERGGAFGQDSLDALAHSLSPSAWLNPHKSILGTGNYDVNVLMAALRTRGSHALWFDKRKDVGLLKLENILGFILNVPSEYRLGGVLPLPLHRRHWVAIRAIGNTYYNLDSKLRAPEPVGEESDLLAYLRDQLHSKEKELFVVVSDEVENSHSWLNSPSEESERGKE
ncbi:josephin-2-like, partial [Hetaerina americana]|uniref:josephin-2-like n=1 Tax=Hetaerina americana TaxID=62018 RepID=UPI003A7F15DE